MKQLKMILTDSLGPQCYFRERTEKPVMGEGEGEGGLMRNYLLLKKIGGPLLAALNNFRDPLLETPPTYLMATNQYTLQKSEEKNTSKEHNDLLRKAEKRQGKPAKPLESQPLSY